MRACLLLAAAFCASSACTDASSPADPACADPAPLNGSPSERVIGYLVQFHDGINAIDETSRLQHVYQIEPSYVSTFVPLFSASFDDSTRDRLRCEPAVKSVEYDGPGTPPP